MRKTFLLIVGCFVALALASGMAWAQMGGGRGMMMQPGQSRNQQQPGYGPGYGYGMMGPGMMGGGYGGGYGMMGPGMMMGRGGGYGMMGPGMMMGRGGGYGMMGGGGMMGMMMNHMMGGGYGMMGMGGMGMGYMLNYLDLSADQWKKVRALAAERLDKMNDMMAKMSKLRLELWNLSSQDRLDPAKVKKLFAQKAELHADLYLSGRDYLQKIKGILTKEQLKRLENWRY